MATADQRYAEKIAARASRRAPVFQQQVVVPASGASAHERYLAKLAARRAGVAGLPSGEASEVKPDAKADKPQQKAKTDEGKATEAKPDAKDAPKK